MLQNFLKIKTHLKKLKLRLNNTTIDKTSTYPSVTWILTKRDRKQMNIFESKVYRRILGPVFIHLVVCLRQVQSLFQSELPTYCDLELPLSNESILSFL